VKTAAPAASARPAPTGPEPRAAGVPASGTASLGGVTSQSPAGQTAVVPAPSLAGCKDGSPAFAEDFKPPQLGWTGGLGPRDSGSNAYVADGHLVIKPPTKRSRTIIYPSLVLKSTVICAMIVAPQQIVPAPEVTGQLTAGGVAFWAVNSANLYTFEVATDGTYNIARLVDSNWSFIGSKLKSDAIRQGPGAKNEFEVRIKQNVAELLVNGVKVQEIRGQPPTGISTIGFVARNYTEHDYEWQFLNLSAVEHP